MENQKKRFIFGIILNSYILESNGITKYPLCQILEAIERNITDYVRYDKDFQFSAVDLKSLVGKLHEVNRITEIELKQLSILTLKNTIEKCLNIKYADNSNEMKQFALKIFGIISKIQNQELVNQLLIFYFTRYKGCILELYCSQILTGGKH